MVAEEELLRHGTNRVSRNRHYAASLFANHISGMVRQEAVIDSKKGVRGGVGKKRRIRGGGRHQLPHCHRRAT